MITGKTLLGWLVCFALGMAFQALRDWKYKEDLYAALNQKLNQGKRFTLTPPPKKRMPGRIHRIY